MSQSSNEENRKVTVTVLEVKDISDRFFDESKVPISNDPARLEALINKERKKWDEEIKFDFIATTKHPNVEGTIFAKLTFRPKVGKQIEIGMKDFLHQEDYYDAISNEDEKHEITVKHLNDGGSFVLFRGEHFQSHRYWVTAEQGLTTVSDCYKFPKTPKPGDRVKVPRKYSPPDFRSQISAIFVELEKIGALNIELLNGKYAVTDFQMANSELNDRHRLHYLTEIFKIIQCCDSIPLPTLSYRDWFNCPKCSTPPSAASLIEFGYLISNYFWKFEHEIDAISEKTASKHRQMGGAQTGRKNSEKAWEAREAILRIATKKLREKPNRITSWTQLATLIQKQPDCPQSPKDLGNKMSVKAIERHLRIIRGEKKLPAKVKNCAPSNLMRK